MKNLKIYKSSLALLTATSILLLNGCSASKNEIKENNETKEKACTHLTVYFEDSPVTFKECEGYDINYSFGNRSGKLSYTINKDGSLIVEGVTQSYNQYDVNHSIADELIDEKSVQKVK